MPQQPQLPIPEIYIPRPIPDDREPIDQGETKHRPDVVVIIPKPRPDETKPKPEPKPDVGTETDVVIIKTTDGTSTTTQVRPKGCVPTKVPVYTEKDQPGVDEYAFCGEQNLRGSQTLKRTNLHHNYVHDINHLHNYHNRIKHQARNFNTVVKDCSCVGESEQAQGCACEADP